LTLVFGEYDAVLVEATITLVDAEARKLGCSGQAKISGNRFDFREENKMTTKGKVLVLVSSGHGLPLKDGKV
jgi:hypothetical protein